MKTGSNRLRRKFPFASEFVMDAKGRVSKVILDVPTLERLLEDLEDAGLIRAMKAASGEKPLSKTEALKQLARD